MKLNAKQLLFLAGLVVAGIIILLFRSPIHIGSSLNDLFPIQIGGKVLPKGVTGKYANLLNIVVEADSFKVAKEKSDQFINRLIRADIPNITYQVPHDTLAQSLNYFKAHQNSFLSTDARVSLLNSDTAEIREKAIRQIQTSWMPPVLSLRDDPFLLLSDYVQNISKPDSAWSEREGVLWQERDGKNYILAFIRFDQSDINTLLNQIHLIRDLLPQKDSDYKIHLSGAPLHTAQTFEKTKGDITLISCLAFLMLLALAYLLFHRMAPVILVFINLVIAFISGLLCVFLFVPDVHFLTFAFGSSLVGICIDYSFHRFYCRDKKIPLGLLKNILYSFLTTVACFIPLLLSDLSLLRQIALFTIGGLSGTFLWILITLPPAYKESKNPSFEFLNFPLKKVFFPLFLIICILGYTKIYIDHSPQNLYDPSPELQKEETFFHHLNGESFRWLLLIHGDNLNSVLKKEEKIKDRNPFFGLSTMLPSVERQKQNFTLIQNLYDQELTKLVTELGLKKISGMKQTPLVNEKEFKNQFDFLFRQFVVTTPDGVWTITPLTKKIETPDKDSLIFEPAKYVAGILDGYASHTYRILYISFGFLFLILFIIYRKDVFRYILPSLLGGLGTLGILSLFAQGITFFHLIALFVVIGLSMDYTIFLFGTDRLHKSVLFAFLSSLIGFGLLSFIHFRMIAVMGQTIALGLLLSFAMIYLIRKDLNPQKENKGTTDWYSVKEQCAGRYRLLFLWWVYKIFRLKGLKIILFPIVFFITIFSKNGRLTSRKYREVLYTYQVNHNIKPTKFSSFTHIYSYAFSLAEKMSAICDPQSPLKFDVLQDENWKSFQKDLPRGVFLISSHLGNIEALSAFPNHLSPNCPKVNALMQINQTGIFHQFIQERANNSYFCLYPAEQFGFTEVMSLYEKIEKGESILMAGDRISSQNSKDIFFAKLLDKKCALPKGVFRFARKINHPTYAILLLRTTTDAYKFILKKLDITAPEQDIIKEYIDFIEKYLIKYPDQWYNFFDFFK